MEWDDRKKMKNKFHNVTFYFLFVFPLFLSFFFSTFDLLFFSCIQFFSHSTFCQWENADNLYTYEIFMENKSFRRFVISGDVMAKAKAKALGVFFELLLQD